MFCYHHGNIFITGDSNTLVSQKTSLLKEEIQKFTEIYTKAGAVLAGRGGDLCQFYQITVFGVFNSIGLRKSPCHFQSVHSYKI